MTTTSEPSSLIRIRLCSPCLGRKMRHLIGSVFGLFLGFSHAWAASPWSAGISLGTLGAGLVVSRDVVPESLSIEASIQESNLYHSYDSGGGHTDGTVQLRSAMMRANYAPFLGRFFLSAGVLYNDSRINLQATATAGGYVLNGHTYSAQDVSSLDGQARYARWDPYLGVGWQGNAPVVRGWHWQVDVGALYQGGAMVHLQGVTTLGGAQQTALRTDLDAQRQDLTGALNQLRWYPVLGLVLQRSF